MCDRRYGRPHTPYCGKIRRIIAIATVALWANSSMLRWPHTTVGGRATRIQRMRFIEKKALRICDSPTAATAHGRPTTTAVSLMPSNVFFIGYMEFRGRSSRREFWLAMLFFIPVSVLIFLIPAAGTVSGILWMLATMVPIMAISFRRLHDANRTAGGFCLGTSAPFWPLRCWSSLRSAWSSSKSA